MLFPRCHSWAAEREAPTLEWRATGALGAGAGKSVPSAVLQRGCASSALLHSQPVLVEISSSDASAFSAGPQPAVSGLQVSSAAVMPASPQPHPTLPGAAQSFQVYKGLFFSFLGVCVSSGLTEGETAAFGPSPSSVVRHCLRLHSMPFGTGIKTYQCS